MMIAFISVLQWSKVRSQLYLYIYTHHVLSRNSHVNRRKKKYLTIENNSNGSGFIHNPIFVLYMDVDDQNWYRIMSVWSSDEGITDFEKI